MGKTIVITGASRGLGLAIAQYIVKDGHNVVLVARSKDALESLHNKYPKQVRFVAGDLVDFALAHKTVKLANDEFGAVDGLIINHGTLIEMKRIADTSPEEWKQIYDVNVFSAVAFAQAALPSLRKAKGSLIFTSTGASKKANVAWGVYGSSKAVLDHLAGTIGAEEPDVTSLAIAPGVVDTDMQKELREKHCKNFSDADADRYITLHKEGKLLRPEQPGSLMARLALAPPHHLSGKYFRWDVPELAAFRKDDD